MSNTGNIFPGTGENNTGIGATGWTGPGNIVSDNTTDATCNAAASSQYLVARNFGLSIPAGATINGILVRIEASEHSGGTEALLARLQDASGTLFGTGKSTSNEGAISGTVKAVYTYGSTSDVWGAALTPAIVNDPDFGVRFWFTTAHDVRADYVTIAVEYSEPVSASPGVGDLLLTGFGPSIAVTTNVVVSVGAGEILASGFAPNVTASDHKNISTDLGALTLDGFAPTVETPKMVVTDKGELILTGFIPSVDVTTGSNQNILPETGQAIITGFGPSVNTTDHKNIMPGLGEILFNGFEPVVETPVSVNTALGQLIAQGFEPSVSSGGFGITDTGVSEILIVGFAPSVSITSTIVYPVLNLTSSVGETVTLVSVFRDSVLVSQVESGVNAESNISESLNLDSEI